MMTRKQKAGQSKAHEGEQSPKKKAKNGKKNDSRNGKSEDNIAIKNARIVHLLRPLLVNNKIITSGEEVLLQQLKLKNVKRHLRKGSSGRRLSVDRPEGFLALAVVSLEDLVIQVKKFTVLKLSLCLNGKVVSTFLKPKKSISS
uniref:Uncharacterized protein n=1 Tax=Salix viminalis TaxID=40686 RepID=A0A6N2LMX9_SALVM